MLALLAASALLAAEGPSPVLHVRLDADAQLPCPAGAALVEALRRGLPGVRVTTEGAPSGDDLDLAVSLGDAGWTLQVTRASGEPGMTRVLPFAPERRCDELAETWVLILERFLADIRWAGRPVTVDALEPPAPPPPAPPPPSAAPEMTPLPPSPRTRVALALGPSAAVGYPLEPALGLSVEVAVLPRETVRAGLWLAGGTSGNLPIQVGGEVRGAVSVATVFALAFAGLCQPLGRASLCGGPALGAAFNAASASGAYVYSPRDRRFALPEAGLFGRFGLALTPSLDVALHAIAASRLGRIELVVEGTDAGYTTPWVDGVLSLHLAWSFF